MVRLFLLTQLIKSLTVEYTIRGKRKIKRQRFHKIRRRKKENIVDKIQML